MAFYALVENGVKLHGCTLGNGIKVGYRTYANDTMIRSNTEIGRYCSIGRRGTIGAAFHPTDWLTAHPVGYAEKARDHGRASNTVAKTTIGNDVWVGDNVIVIEGITVGDGAVIGAGAVVTRDIAPYEIVGGVPARKIRDRFPADISTELLALGWWRYEPTILDGLPLWDIAATVGLLRERIAGKEPPLMRPHHQRVKARTLASPKRGLARLLPF
jgi:virginiamycin A acetyltransferase